MKSTPSSNGLMRRLALPILGLLAYGLVFLTDAQGVPPSCGAGSAALSVQQIRGALPPIPDGWTPPLPFSSPAEIGEELSDYIGVGPSTSAAIRQAAVRVAQVGVTATSIIETAVLALPLYHLYCVLLI